jgi:hypothetical protein
MKRALVLALAVLLATSAFADRRTEKTQLISEVLQLLDLRGLTQATFLDIFDRARELDPNDEKWKRVRERVAERFDYDRYAEEVYAPLLDENFNNDELKELIAFFWHPTMANIRTIATSIEARATDTNDYPTVVFEDLAAVVQPIYIRALPPVDGWGNPFFYVSDGMHYRIVSAGADRKFEWGSRELALEQKEIVFTSNEDADIIYQDGSFLQAPAAAKQQ